MNVDNYKMCLRTQAGSASGAYVKLEPLNDYESLEETCQCPPEFTGRCCESRG